LLLAIAAIAVAGAAYLTLIAIYSRSIEDDWGFLDASAHLSFIHDDVQGAERGAQPPAS
jgi:hypothetical protein